MLEYVVEGRYQRSEQDRPTMFVQRKKLVETANANVVLLAPWTAGFPPMSPKLASAKEIRDKNLERAPWLFHGFFDDYLKDDGKIEFLSNWSPNYNNT